jgi:MFS transporter, AAHS family, 4-hydroxybenzoate transporter
MSASPDGALPQANPRGIMTRHSSPGEPKTPINVRELAEKSRVTGFHLQILAVCFATAVVDGLDNQVIGFSATSISAALHIPLSAFGAVFSAGTTGALLGAASLGMLADRMGRQKALMLCTLLFTAFTLITPLARSAPELIGLRFMAGLGLGGAMPGFLTLVSEYAPRSRRALATGVLWSGYAVGGMTGGLIGSFVLPHFGWKAMFFLGGGLAFAVALAQWRLLPESLQFLVLRSKADARIMALARRLAPGLDVSQVEFIADKPALGQPKGTLVEIFSDGRALSTVLLWVPLFFTFMIANFFVLWSPALFKTAGLSLSTAALMVALNNFATVPSQAVSGYLIDKTSPFRLLPVAYGLMSLVIGILAFSLHATPLVAIAMLSIGFLQGPGLAGMLFLATSIYPARIRSTGVGWATGVGRSGQIVGALVIGGLVARGVAPNWIIFGMCAPPLLALICILLLGVAVRRLPAAAAV